MNTVANCLAIAFTLHFLWSYYWTCYSKGYKIDVWHFGLGVNLFVIHWMLPFSRSNLNMFVLGPVLWHHAAPFVDEAYFISAAGYAAILLGGSLWRVRLGWGLRRAFSRAVELPARGVLIIVRSRRLVIVHCLIGITLMGIALAIYFSISGFGFNLRGLLLVFPALRALAQFAAFYSILAGGYAFARYAMYREREMLLLTLIIAVGFIFYGERSNIIVLFSTVALVTLIRLRRRARLLYLAAAILATLFAVMLLDALRNPHFSLGNVLTSFGFSIFYGNSFSDTRDFAIILSYWDGHLMLGKTYLAGLIAFIPRFVSSFRDTWAIGVVTARLAGFSPLEHPGLRVGLFGEAFLNFGMAGVILVGLFSGMVVRLIDLRVKQSLAELPRSGVRVYAYFILAYWTAAAQNSSAASSFYTVLVFIGVSWVMIRASRFLKLPLG
ncbi:MAG: hypothetical protein ABI147_15005 [Acidobacteriaceae bacterium]